MCILYSYISTSVEPPVHIIITAGETGSIMAFIKLASCSLISIITELSLLPKKSQKPLQLILCSMCIIYTILLTLKCPFQFFYNLHTYVYTFFDSLTAVEKSPALSGWSFLF